jgi:predicted RNA-binding protein with TRAM domain
VTVTLKAVPTVSGDAAETTNLVAAAAFTVIVPDVPVMEDVTVSVAVIVRFPAVFSVAENVPTPFVNVESAGKVAEPSVLVKCTVPAYSVAVFPP